MPHQAGAELRAQEGRARAVHEARGKIVTGALAEPSASEIRIQIPAGGVAMLDGTSTTDAALERKLASAVARNPAIKVTIAYDESAHARAQAVEAIVRRSGATAIELAVGMPAVVLTIAANGTLTLGARAVTDAALDQELALLGKRTKQLSILAAKDAPYAAVVKLVDRAKAAGLTDVKFVLR